jgi:hypothetical protein
MFARREAGKAPPARRNDAGAHLPSLYPFSHRGEGAERRRSAPCRVLTVRRVSVAASNAGRSPLGAPPRCCIRAGPFFRIGPGRITRPLSRRTITSALRSDPYSVPPWQRSFLAEADGPPGAPVSPGLRTRPTGHRSPLRLHERLMKAPSASRDAAYVTHGPGIVKRCVTEKVAKREPAAYGPCVANPRAHQYVQFQGVTPGGTLSDSAAGGSLPAWPAVRQPRRSRPWPSCANPAPGPGSTAIPVAIPPRWPLCR